MRCPSPARGGKRENHPFWDGKCERRNRSKSVTRPGTVRRLLVTIRIGNRRTANPRDVAKGRGIPFTSLHFDAKTPDGSSWCPTGPDTLTFRDYTLMWIDSWLPQCSILTGMRDEGYRFRPPVPTTACARNNLSGQGRRETEPFPAVLGGANRASHNSYLDELFRLCLPRYRLCRMDGLLPGGLLTAVGRICTPQFGHTSPWLTIFTTPHFGHCPRILADYSASDLPPIPNLLSYAQAADVPTVGAV